MGIVDRGGRDGRRPRSRWPADRAWPPRDHAPEPPPHPRRARPTATYLIMAICIGVFVYGESTDTMRVLVEKYAYFPSRLGQGGSDGYLGLITYMFLHGGTPDPTQNWLHLVVNMVVFWSFGRGLEPIMGSFRFVVLYFASGVIAAIAHGIILEPADIALVGASGAIAGVLGAAVVASPRLPVIFVIFPMPLWIAVVALVALHIAAIAFDWDPQVAWYAHLAGLAAGALLYPLLRRRHAA